MALGLWRVTALVAAAALSIGACSSSPASSSAPNAPSDSASSSSSSSSSGSSGSAVQTYLAAVNRLCDALLPKVVAVTHGGSLDIPVKAYFAQRRAHAALLVDFDRQLARVPIPSAARTKAAAFAAYVRFADRLDARRLAAARRGEAAYAKEIRSEASVESDPAISELHAAGFGQSCEAR